MTAAFSLYLLTRIGIPCAVLLVLAVLYIPWWGWAWLAVSFAPAVSQLAQAWFRRPVLVRGER